MRYILSQRVDLKYLDPIHGSKCISLFPASSSFLTYIVFVRYLPFVIEIFLDRPAMEANLMNHPGENEV